MTVAEERDSPPPIPLGNQEEAASTEETHPNTIPVQGGIDGAVRSVDSVKSQGPPPVTEEVLGPIDVIMHEDPNETDTDLLSRIHGLYRLLDLISEQGSGGAGMMIVSNMTRWNSLHLLWKVDKIIISQESVAKLVNDIRPGAYTSMTKVRNCIFCHTHGVLHALFRRLTSMRWTNVIWSRSESTAVYQPS